jgi:hypothetical protein
MQKENMNGVELIYNKKYTKEASIVKNIHKNISDLIISCWGINKPSYYKIYILRSNLKYFFYVFPWYYKIILGITLPFWYFNINKLFKSWGSFTISSKNFLSILLKPIKVYSSLHNNIGTLILHKEVDEIKLFKSVVCQEIFYVHLSSIQLPKWLTKGLAIFTVNKYFNRETVKENTLEMLNENNYKKIDNKNLNYEQKETIAYNYVKGYWTVRYLEENYPGFLKESFKKKDLDIEKEIAKKIGISTDKESFWSELDEFLYNYFNDKLR